MRARNIGGEKDEGGGSVNEVTRLLIGNELRLGVFNESAQVSSSLHVRARISQGRDGRGGIRREAPFGVCNVPEMCWKQPEIRARTYKTRRGLPKISLAGFSEM